MKHCPFFKVILLSVIFCSCSKDGKSTAVQPISFGAEVPVTISGYTSDAMEPFISPDGTYLFFNNMNDGVNTKLFYAVRTNDNTFTFEGELPGTNQVTPPHLDAVADLDKDNNFYWTSTRNYPAELDNLFHGTFTAGTVQNIQRVHGDFNKNTPGWLVMDHGISADGQYLYFNNARFDDANCVGPCETEIGIAQKVNTTEFARVADSEFWLEKVNNPNYINYAPCISQDGLELYFSRYLKNSITTQPVFEICVAIRASVQSAFSEPQLLFSDSSFLEAPSLAADSKRMYYHKKVSGVYKIMMRQLQ